MTKDIDGVKYRYGSRALPYIALTFDDGPHASLTPKLLDILAEEGVPATFYVLGERVQRYPSIIERMKNEGHEIGNHTHTHPNLIKLSKNSVKNEIVPLQNRLKNQLGIYPATFRPPYGSFSLAQAKWLKENYNLTSVHWDVDPRDWQNKPSAATIRKRLVSKAQPGSILLLHDIIPNSVAATPLVIKDLRKKGYIFVTVSELLKISEYRQKSQ